MSLCSACLLCCCGYRKRKASDDTVAGQGDRSFPSDVGPGGRHKVTLSSVLSLQRESENSTHDSMSEF